MSRSVYTYMLGIKQVNNGMYLHAVYLWHVCPVLDLSKELLPETVLFLQS